MTEFVFNNSRNYNHVGTYGKGAVYDMYKRTYALAEQFKSGDIGHVLSYSVNGKDIKVLTYRLKCLEDAGQTLVVRGELLAKKVIHKSQAARDYPSMFDINNNFMRTLITKHRN